MPSNRTVIGLPNLKSQTAQLSTRALFEPQPSSPSYVLRSWLYRLQRTSHILHGLGVYIMELGLYSRVIEVGP